MYNSNSQSTTGSNEHTIPNINNNEEEKINQPILQNSKPNENDSSKIKNETMEDETSEQPENNTDKSNESNELPNTSKIGTDSTLDSDQVEKVSTVLQAPSHDNPIESNNKTNETNEPCKIAKTASISPTEEIKSTIEITNDSALPSSSSTSSKESSPLSFPSKEEKGISPSESDNSLKVQPNSLRSSTSSLSSVQSTPKSILRKRRTVPNDNSEYSSTSSLEEETDEAKSLRRRKKHIEFSDENIVYSLNYPEGEEEGSSPSSPSTAHSMNDQIYESVTEYLIELVKKFFVFALVIGVGFSVSYYTFKKSNGKKGSSSMNGLPMNPSDKWHRPLAPPPSQMKSPLKRIESLTLTKMNTEDSWSSTTSTTTPISTPPKHLGKKTSSTTISSFKGSDDRQDTAPPKHSSLKQSQSMSNQKEEAKARETSHPNSHDDVYESKEKEEGQGGNKGKDSQLAGSTKDKDKVQEKVKRENTYYPRVIAVGDIHGDFPKAQRVLQLAKLINKKNNWIGGDSILVQTGDLIDRGPDTKLIFNLLIKLKRQAEKAGGRVYLLLGNHEIMNLQDDYRYVSRSDVMSFGGMQNRREEFSINGKIGHLLRTEMNATIIVQDSVFVHAGLIDKFAVFGVDQLNEHVHYILQHYPPNQLMYAPIFSNNGPFWTRYLSLGPESSMCEEVDKVLSTLKVKRMIVGHTVQDNGKVGIKCNGKFLMIDVGMSEFYGGNLAFLEILNKDEVWAIYSETRSERIKNY